jgi:hypothetical protein
MANNKNKNFRGINVSPFRLYLDLLGQMPGLDSLQNLWLILLTTLKQIE